MTAHSAQHRVGVRLSEDDQQTLDGLVERHGDWGTARLLGVTPDAVSRLAHRGHAQPARVSRMADALRVWRERGTR